MHFQTAIVERCNLDCKAATQREQCDLCKLSELSNVEHVESYEPTIVHLGRTGGTHMSRSSRGVNRLGSRCPASWWAPWAFTAATACSFSFSRTCIDNTRDVTVPVMTQCIHLTTCPVLPIELGAFTKDSYCKRFIRRSVYSPRQTYGENPESSVGCFRICHAGW